MIVLIGCPVANRGWVLPTWFECIEKQIVAPNIHIKTVCLYTDSEDDTWEILEERSTDIITDKYLKSRPTDRIVNHLWQRDEGEYAYMANLRNNLVEFAQRQNADFFFSLDSDVLIPPNTVQKLVDSSQGFAKATAPLVDLSIAPDMHAYNFMSFEGGDDLGGSRLDHTEIFGPKAFSADIIMAAIFMNRGAMTARWSDHRQGEDIGWSIDAANKGIFRLVDPSIVTRHIMHPMDSIPLSEVPWLDPEFTASSSTTEAPMT